jgi:hypothetical protein
MSVIVTESPISEKDMIAQAEKALADISAVRDGVGRVIFGQESVVERTLVALLAGGHALLVGVPGLAKTKLVETLGIVLGLDTRRVQFTPDLMPSDILGSEVMEQDENGRRSFRFIPGPIFAQLLMADEVNRASSPLPGSAMICPHLFMCWRPRTRWSRKAHTPCPRPSSTASSCRSTSSTRIWTPNAAFFWKRRERPRSAPPTSSRRSGCGKSRPSSAACRCRKPLSTRS